MEHPSGEYIGELQASTQSTDMLHPPSPPSPLLSRLINEGPQSTTGAEQSIQPDNLWGHLQTSHCPSTILWSPIAAAQDFDAPAGGSGHPTIFATASLSTSVTAIFHYIFPLLQYKKRLSQSPYRHLHHRQHGQTKLTPSTFSFSGTSAFSFKNF